MRKMTLKKDIPSLDHPNYSFVPNHRSTMEALARSRLSGREFRCVILILNQTNGYLRHEDKIKPNFFSERTGLLKNHLSHALQRLKSWNMIAERERYVYTVNPPELWDKTALFSQREKVAKNSESPKTAEKVAKNGESLAKNGEKQIPSIIKPSNKKPKERGLAAPTLAQNGEKQNFSGYQTEVAQIFQEMRQTLGCPQRTNRDPIPSYGKEGQAIKRMLARGFTREEILECWNSKVTQRGGDFVSMIWVNEDIGKARKHEPRQTRPEGPATSGRNYPQSSSGYRPKLASREQLDEFRRQLGQPDD